MTQYRLSVRAKNDLMEIARFTQKEWGEAQARKYVGALEQFLRLLATSPGIGRDCGEVSAGLRRMEYRSHTIFFLLADDGILISRILHKGRDIADHDFAPSG
jgi:toxin ParE1/3/4